MAENKEPRSGLQRFSRRRRNRDAEENQASTNEGAPDNDNDGDSEATVADGPSPLEASEGQEESEENTVPQAPTNRRNSGRSWSPRRSPAKADSSKDTETFLTTECSVCSRKEKVFADSLPPDGTAYVCAPCRQEQLAIEPNAPITNLGTDVGDSRGNDGQESPREITETGSGSADASGQTPAETAAHQIITAVTELASAESVEDGTVVGVNTQSQTEDSVDEEGEERTQEAAPPAGSQPGQTSIASALGARHWVCAIGGTGTQTLDQLLRGERDSVSRFSAAKFNYGFLDTSNDLNFDELGYSHTREGVRSDRQWIDENRLFRLANLATGAGKVPPIAEFVASATLHRRISPDQLNMPFFEELKTASITFLIHSASGGTGGGLAPAFAEWMKGEGIGGDVISIVNLGIGDEAVETPFLVGNALYNFPKINRAVQMAILIDNKVVASKANKNGNGVSRYLNYIERTILHGRPEYQENSPREYMLSDRFAYRIMSVLTRLPNDVADIIRHLQTDADYNQGARWLVPYIYPLDSEYETSYEDVPPAYLALRALEDGGLCDVVPENPQGTQVVVLFEAPQGYDRGKAEKDVQQVVAEKLRVRMDQVVVRTPTTPEGINGVAVTILWLRPETSFMKTWCDLKENEDDRTRLIDDWHNSVGSAGEDSAGHPRRQRAVSGRLELIINGIVSACAGLGDLDLNPEDVAKLRRDGPSMLREKADLDICQEFFDFATEVGLMSGVAGPGPGE